MFSLHSILIMLVSVFVSHNPSSSIRAAARSLYRLFVCVDVFTLPRNTEAADDDPMSDSFPFHREACYDCRKTMGK